MFPCKCANFIVHECIVKLDMLHFNYLFSSVALMTGYARLLLKIPFKPTNSVVGPATSKYNKNNMKIVN